MKLRAASLITALVLLFSAISALSLAEMDYGTVYETAIRLASNDLSNITNLQDAVEMLRQTGTYGFSRSYLIYFQQIAAMQTANPDFNTIILMLEVCKDIAPFNEDLETRNLPSCMDLIAYSKARTLEQQGKLNEACAAYRTMFILDAPDRATSLALTIANATPTPTMIETSPTSTPTPKPTKTPTPTPKPTDTPTPKPTATPTPTPTAKPIKPVEVGSIIQFGYYEQDNKTKNGKEPIEWIVLDYDANNYKVLLLSRYGLDVIPYNNRTTEVTWEKCSLRAWLNGEFLQNAFSKEEQKAIIITEVDNSENQKYDKWSRRGGKNTQDQIFLLSYAEANRYLGPLEYSAENTKNTKSCVTPTAYAIAHGALVVNRYEKTGGVTTVPWWLRSPGLYSNNAANVTSNGTLGDYPVDGEDVVRPALWLDLESGII